MFILIDKKSPNFYKENLIYSFDNGVILNGLCSLYKLTKKNFFLKVLKSVQIGLFMNALIMMVV